jgi:hypothetical protein
MSYHTAKTIRKFKKLNFVVLGMVFSASSADNANSRPLVKDGRHSRATRLTAPAF